MPAITERDWLTVGNAAELARRIERYWAEEAAPGSARVLLRVEVAKFREHSEATPHTMGWVRSNLVNGLPRRKGDNG